MCLQVQYPSDPIEAKSSSHLVTNIVEIFGCYLGSGQCRLDTSKVKDVAECLSWARALPQGIHEFRPRVFESCQFLNNPVRSQGVWILSGPVILQGCCWANKLKFHLIPATQIIFGVFSFSLQDRDPSDPIHSECLWHLLTKLVKTVGCEPGICQRRSDTRKVQKKSNVCCGLEHSWRVLLFCTSYVPGCFKSARSKSNMTFLSPYLSKM